MTMETVKERAEKLYGRLGELHDMRMNLEDLVFNNTELLAERKLSLESLKESLISPHLVDGQLPGKNHDIRIRKEREILGQAPVYLAMEVEIATVEANLKNNKHQLFKVEKELGMIRDRINLLNIISSSLDPVYHDSEKMELLVEGGHSNIVTNAGMDHLTRKGGE